MNAPTSTTQLRAEDLVPPTVLRRVVDRSHFATELTRYAAMSDGELYHVTEVCLRNLGPLDDESAGPDADLRIILVPELWERLRPGSRDSLRRITLTLAEYQADSPSIFARMLSPGSLTRLRASADDLRRRVATATVLSAGALVEQTRFAVAGSHMAATWPPDYSVYESGFTYRLVPVVAWRVLVQERRQSLA